MVISATWQSYRICRAAWFLVSSSFDNPRFPYLWATKEPPATQPVAAETWRSCIWMLIINLFKNPVTDPQAAAAGQDPILVAVTRFSRSIMRSFRGWVH